MDTMARSSKMTLKVIIVILMALLPAQSLVAQWLAPWLYRSSITVSNSLSTGLTDYQVKITLNTSNFNFNFANSDGSDIRVTQSDGTLVPFWIESWTPGTAASIWVKVPSIPASGSTTILSLLWEQRCLSKFQ